MPTKKRIIDKTKNKAASKKLRVVDKTKKKKLKGYTGSGLLGKATKAKKRRKSALKKT